MKNTISTFLMLLIFHNLSFAQDSNCVRKAKFGETEICLSQINGYQESYVEPKVKQLADDTEVPTNMILGFYLNNQTYEKRDSLGLFSFDDYFKVYGTKEIKNHQADSKLLQEMQTILSNNFVKKEWELIKKEVDEIGLDIEIGVPMVIKTYNLNDNSFTLVMLTRYEFEGGNSYTMAMAINGLLINERLIWMAYYLNYTSEETISRLQENSNAILVKLLNAGK